MYTDVFSSTEEVELIYLIEILPPVKANSVQIEEPGNKGANVTKVDARDGDTEMQSLKSNGGKFSKTFEGMKREEKYTVRVSTVINGRTIARKGQVLKPQVLKPQA